MEPRIQYAKTEDGVSIAYWTLGEGMPVVQVPAGIFSHIQLEWQTPQLRQWYERIAQKRMYVRYDGRGTGMSDRDAADHTLEALVLDLEAVVDRLGLKSFCLFGLFGYAPVAIKYAVQHPERVSHLILWMATARISDMPPAWQAFEELKEKDWSLYSEALAGLMGGEPAEVRAASVFIRESVTPETAKAISDAQRQFDATALLPKVTAPTLVLHRPQAQFLNVDEGKRLASQIPDARLVLLEGTSSFTMVGDVEPVLDAFDEFLGDGGEVTAPPAAAPTGMVTILFTDMESSTALTQSLGDAKAQELVRTHNAIVRDALGAHGGSETKHTGDGIMASFPSTSGALECAIAIQRGVAAHAEEHPGTTLRVRIGLNAGEPVAEEEDLFGTAVQLARRTCDHAQPGQIVAADVVRQLAAGKQFLFADLGEIELRGFEDPVRLYELRWREES